MERALVFASIVLGVAIALELQNLHHLLQAKNVRWHWAQPVFALFVMLNTVAYWWGIPQSEAQISFLQFLPALFQLVMLVLLAAVSLPDRMTDEGLDLAQYYQDKSSYQWLIMALFFWALHTGFLIRVFRMDLDLSEKLIMLAPDTFAGLIIVGMVFVKRWALVAVGMGILSLAPIAWAARTLG